MKANGNQGHPPLDEQGSYGEPPNPIMPQHTSAVLPLADLFSNLF